MEMPVFTGKGEPAGSLAAPSAFGKPAGGHAVYLAVLRQLANARTGTQSTKTKGLVSGGGRKPWTQKGTGRARQGSIRAPQWRGGGVAFGPLPRKYGKDLPEKVRRIALRGALARKIGTGRVVVLKGLDLEEPRTRHAAAFLKKLGFGRSALLIFPSVDPMASRAFRNLPEVRLEPADAVTVFDILKFRHVAILEGALDPLARRCG